MLNEKGELNLLSTENSHSTQQTELEAIEEEMSENDTPSENYNDSNIDEEAEEEYWQKAGKNQGSDDEETCDFATVAIPLP